MNSEIPEKKGFDFPERKIKVPEELQTVDNDVKQKNVQLNIEDYWNILKGYLRKKSLEVIANEKTDDIALYILIAVVIIIVLLLFR